MLTAPTEIRLKVACVHRDCASWVLLSGLDLDKISARRLRHTPSSPLEGLNPICTRCQDSRSILHLSLKSLSGGVPAHGVVMLVLVHSRWGSLQSHFQAAIPTVWSVSSHSPPNRGHSKLMYLAMCRSWACHFSTLAPLFVTSTQ